MNNIVLKINPCFNVSSDGKIFPNGSNVELPAKETKKGLKVKVPFGSKANESWLIQDLVYASFNPDKELSTVYHIDGNPLNNAIDNLTLEKPTKQKPEFRKQRKCEEGKYRGVVETKTGFVARINGVHLGSFSTPEEAGRQYDLNVPMVYGPKGVLNFPK